MRWPAGWPCSCRPWWPPGCAWPQSPGIGDSQPGRQCASREVGADRDVISPRSSAHHHPCSPTLTPLQDEKTTAMITDARAHARLAESHKDCRVRTHPRRHGHRAQSALRRSRRLTQAPAHRPVVCVPARCRCNPGRSPPTGHRLTVGQALAAWLRWLGRGCWLDAREHSRARRRARPPEPLARPADGGSLAADGVDPSFPHATAADLPELALPCGVRVVGGAPLEHWSDRRTCGGTT